MKSIDIVILSHAKTDKLHQVTLNCLRSLNQSIGKEDFNIIVVEGNKDIKYDNVTTLYTDEPFHYNRYMNLALKQCNSEWIAACNNDLFFDKNWYVELMKHKYDSMCPKSKTSHTQNHLTKVKEGYLTAQELAGWCIVLKRDTYNKINGFSEDVSFWCSDDAYRMQLLEAGIKHYIIPTSIVNHLEGGSTTLKTIEGKEKEKLTFDQARVYNKIYNKNLFNLN